MDELDEKIVEQIKKEGSVSPNVSEIARNLDKPVTTIHSRIDKLTSKGIIKGYKPIITTEEEEEKITAFILLKAKTGVDPDDLGEKLSEIEQVKEVYFTTGEWYFLLKLKVKNLDEYYEISGERLVKIPELTEVIGMMAPKSYGMEV